MNEGRRSGAEEGKSPLGGGRVLDEGSVVLGPAWYAERSGCSVPGGERWASSQQASR